MTPLYVVEGSTAHVDDLVADLAAVGWPVEPGLTPPARPGTVRHGVVDDPSTAAAAILAAVDGAGLVVDARAERVVVDQLCDDLRRLGEFAHLIPDPEEPLLSTDQRALLALLSDGTKLGEAATRLHLSRRSADRRLAAAREVLGATSTSAAVAAYRKRLDRVPAPV